MSLSWKDRTKKQAPLFKEPLLIRTPNICIRQIRLETDYLTIIKHLGNNSTTRKLSQKKKKRDNSQTCRCYSIKVVSGRHFALICWPFGSCLPPLTRFPASHLPISSLCSRRGFPSPLSNPGRSAHKRKGRRDNEVMRDGDPTPPPYPMWSGTVPSKVPFLHSLAFSLLRSTRIAKLFLKKIVIFRHIF